MHGTPMTEEDVANEFVALAEECDALRRELKAVSSLSMEERRVMVADLNAVFRHYGKAFSPAELEEMLWEADEDMDGALSWEEFKLLCELNLNDRSGLQPWRLFTCVYFLMMDRSEAGFVTEDSVLEILYTRFGKQQMEAEIKALFGDSAVSPPPVSSQAALPLLTTLRPAHAGGRYQAYTGGVFRGDGEDHRPARGGHAAPAERGQAQGKAETPQVAHQFGSAQALGTPQGHAGPAAASRR